MRTVEHLLFEDPWWTYVALGAVEFVLAALWFRGRTGRLVVAMLVPPVLGGAVALTASLIVTDRERIAEALRAIATSAEHGDLEGGIACLDPAVYAPAPGNSTLNRDELVARAREALRRWPVRSIALADIETEISGPNATTALKTRILFGKGSLLDGQTLHAGWRLQWAKRPGGWRVVRIEGTYPSVVKDWTF